MESLTYVQIDLLGWGVVLTLTTRNEEGEPHPDDSGWIETRIHVDGVSFQGRVATQLRLSELLALRAIFAGLRDRTGQDVEERFALDSGALTMHIQLTPTGHIRGEAKVVDFPPDGASLHIPIHADQTYLPLWMTAIDSALETVDEWYQGAEQTESPQDDPSASCSRSGL